MALPSVILHFDFFQSDNPDWKIKGDTNCTRDLYDYMERADSIEPVSEDDYYNYMDKMQSNFDIDNDFLSEEQIEDYRQLERNSRANDCVKYLGYISFENSSGDKFLRENNILTEKGLDFAKLRNVARSAMSELIHSSKKFDADNTYWVGSIHTDTDNVHYVRT